MILRRHFQLAALMACLVAVPAASAQEDTSDIPLKGEIHLEDRSLFEAPPANWRIVGTVSSDRTTEHDLSTRPGTGILANLPDENADGNLTTRMEHGDLILDLDYLMPKGSNSGIYLQGRYEIQLLDSWRDETPGYGASAGIYQRWDESRPEGEKGYEGHPPRINASRAPGLWQRLRIEFLAPEFDVEGRKTQNARIRKVVHNGVVVHENVELTGPTRGPLLPGEAPRGPIVIQGDHGPVAFRDIRYALEVPPDTARTVPESQPVYVDVGREPVFVRSMAWHGGRKITHALNVGFPQGVHYSTDLLDGTIFRIWRGPFADATAMWYSRGTDQTIDPIGSVLDLDDRPSIVAVGPDGNLRSDSSSFRFKGYRIREDGVPVLMYAVGDVRVDDVAFPSPDGSGLVREMTFRSEYDASDVWVRAAVGESIERVGDRSFTVGDRAYYVELDESLLESAYVHETKDWAALVVPVGESGFVRYRLVW